MSRGFKKAWMEDPELKPWLEGDERGKIAYCKFCKSELRPHLSDIKRHTNTSKHQTIARYFIFLPVHY